MPVSGVPRVLLRLEGAVVLGGLDRLSAFGLKYPTAFRDTHLA